MKTCNVCGDEKADGCFRPQHRQCRRCARIPADKKERINVKAEPKPAKAASDGWTSASPISIRIARAEFLSYPAVLREERRAKAEELAQKRPQSYLAKHFEAIYGNE